jgi:hypothetical protein
MKTLAFILAFFASFAAHAEWVEVVKSADQSTIVQGKNLKKTATGAEMMTKWTYHKEISFYISTLSAKDCANGYGEILYRDMSGRIADRSDYVSSGGTIASEIGDWLCLFLAISGTTKGKSL